MYFAIPYWEKHEYLQVNDWKAYLTFMYINYGIPLAFIFTLIGFGLAKLQNCIVARRAVRTTPLT